uniref:Uncharacterized protein n=1 Tax=Mus musculus TaxID=10090 RepID=Q8C3R6_MOUSE|nr:unnamed protein product [Mus musculus]
MVLGTYMYQVSSLPNSAFFNNPPPPGSFPEINDLLVILRCLTAVTALLFLCSQRFLKKASYTLSSVFTQNSLFWLIVTTQISCNKKRKTFPEGKKGYNILKYRYIN